MTELLAKSLLEKPTLSPLTTAILALIQGLLPAMTAIVGGLWVAFTYLEHQNESRLAQQEQAKKDNVTRLLEAKKPFITKQLELYIKSAEIAGELVSINPDVSKADWIKTLREFEKLFWTELSMVEDDNVKKAMQDLYPRLKWMRDQTEFMTEDKLLPIQESSYQLAKALRISIEASWNPPVK
jgi:hypothetical protein